MYVAGNCKIGEQPSLALLAVFVTFLWAFHHISHGDCQKFGPACP
jgi:hypothetical protein